MRKQTIQAHITYSLDIDLLVGEVGLGQSGETGQCATVTWIICTFEDTVEQSFVFIVQIVVLKKD